MAERVLLGMSGGIDSSAAASLLKEQGYEPIGATFVISPYSEKRLFHKGAQKASEVCQKLGIEHITLEIDDFEDEVVKPFVESYLNGETPNPCIICNRRIKFKHLFREAEKRNIVKIATGHYARVAYNSKTDRFELFKGIDSSKDQSYFLWQLPQKYLSKIVFPLGNITKFEVSKYIDKNGLIDRETGESQDICFIPKGDYRNFLEKYKPQVVENMKKGKIVNPDGQVLSNHNGFYNFTIGQRKGFHVDSPGKYYVKSIDPHHNRITVTPNKDLFSETMVIKDCNWVSQKEQDKIEGTLKPRYRSKGAKCLAIRLNKGNYKIEFQKKQRALTPGQSAVLYRGEKVVFGGIISKNKGKLDG
ncbi:MAG: tRNA 2-thiouridine(34) synthase MnmA [Candidatus Marinimicrobia bacterium]|nr:tRNA 2-thiouridine(34) synthase MnmA [Candidatus Neomarinimicrobiota bacterium]